MSDLVCEACPFRVAVKDPVNMEPSRAYGEGLILGALVSDHNAKCNGRLLDDLPDGGFLDAALAGIGPVGGKE